MRTTIEVIVEIEIERPPSAVWAFMIDTERLPEWFGEFEAAHEESDGRVGVGAVVHYTVAPGHRSGTLETVEWDPPRRMAWDARRCAGGAAAHGRVAHTRSPEAGEGRTLFVRPLPA